MKLLLKKSSIIESKTGLETLEFILREESVPYILNERYIDFEALPNEDAPSTIIEYLGIVDFKVEKAETYSFELNGNSLLCYLYIDEDREFVRVQER